MSLLDIRGLDARYGDFQALFGLDFRAEAGETVAVIGANGAGKSTFLKAIAGMVPVAPQAIRFGGRPVGGLRPSEIVAQGVALVPEGRRLFPSLSVEENLLMGGYARRRGEWGLERIYELFPRLRERRAQPAASLSGGEQQMTAIGRALMSNPRLLMCDELSLGLAPKVVGDIYVTLESIRRQGTAMIIVEQDVRQAMAFADRIYCFQEGRVALEGRPRGLVRDRVVQAYFGV